MEVEVFTECKFSVIFSEQVSYISDKSPVSLSSLQKEDKLNVFITKILHVIGESLLAYIKLITSLFFYSLISSMSVL